MEIVNDTQFERIEPQKGEHVRDLLRAGRWYCVGFYVPNGDGTYRPDLGPIYQFHGVDQWGAGLWTDEAKQFVDDIYDPMLGDRCSLDAADFFVLQS